EHLDEGTIREQLRKHALDDQLASDSHRADRFGLPHFRHPTAAESLDEPILAEMEDVEGRRRIHRLAFSSARGDLQGAHRRRCGTLTETCLSLKFSAPAVGAEATQ